MPLAVSLSGDLVPIPPSSGGPPSGPAGGDLGDDYPNPKVVSAKGGQPLLLDYFTQSSDYTAFDKDQIIADTNSGAFTVTLPNGPSVGQFVTIVDANNTWSSQNLTVGRNGAPIEGNAADLVLNTNGVQVTLVYVGAPKGWRVIYQVTFPTQAAAWTKGASDASDPANSFFSTNSSTIDGTTVIVLSLTPKNGEVGFPGNFIYYHVPFFILLTDSTGGAVQFRVDTAASLGGPTGPITLTGVFIYTYSGSWTGDYFLTVGGIPSFSYVSQVNTETGSPAGAAVTINQVSINTASSITGFNGTVSPVTSITIVDGIITAAS